MQRYNPRYDTVLSDDLRSFSQLFKSSVVFNLRRQEENCHDVYTNHVGHLSHSSQCSESAHRWRHLLLFLRSMRSLDGAP